MADPVDLDDDGCGCCEINDYAGDLDLRTLLRRAIDMGDRVILAAATDRGSDVLGTVIECDPYPDRDALVRVFHDDGIARWRRRDALRVLGHRMPADALAADLQLMAIATQENDR